MVEFGLLKMKTKFKQMKLSVCSGWAETLKTSIFILFCTITRQNSFKGRIIYTRFEGFYQKGVKTPLIKRFFGPPINFVGSYRYRKQKNATDMTQQIAKTEMVNKLLKTSENHQN